MAWLEAGLGSRTPAALLWSSRLICFSERALGAPVGPGPGAEAECAECAECCGRTGSLPCKPSAFALDLTLRNKEGSSSPIDGGGAGRVWSTEEYCGGLKDGWAGAYEGLARRSLARLPWNVRRRLLVSDGTNDVGRLLGAPLHRHLFVGGFGEFGG